MNKFATFMRETGPARFFIPLGIILLAFGIIILIININNSDYIQVDSFVTKTEVYEPEHIDTDGNHIDATYTVYVKYTVDGKEYNAELDGLTNYNEGEKITIYYNPEDPSQITQSISMILPIAIIIGGLIALVGGIISSINSFKRYKKMKEQEKGWANGQ